MFYVYIWLFYYRSDPLADALVTSPCSDNGVGNVVGASDGDSTSAKTGSVREGMYVDDGVDGCAEDRPVQRNLVKYGELIILG